MGATNDRLRTGYYRRKPDIPSTMHDDMLHRDTDRQTVITPKLGTCLVHAAVLEVSTQAHPLDPALLGKLVRRRLTRLERVLAAHGGSVIQQMPHGLLAAFDTAEAAVLVACEMQRRCAVIPQIMETQIGLQIGIHPALNGSNPGESPDTPERMASRLCGLLGEGSIVASDAVIQALPETLREKTSPLNHDDGNLSAHTVNWGAIPMRSAPAPLPETPQAMREIALLQAARIILRRGKHIYRFDGDKTVITIGRDPQNDVVIDDPKASRQHCRIIYRVDSHVLVDLSRNGTFLESCNGSEEPVRKSMVMLSGKGRIGFGHSCRENEDQLYEFEIS